MSAEGLILTKIVPPEPKGLIERSIAAEVRAEALARDLLVVAAGAGYGKTSLLTFLARGEQPTAWLTVTAPDRDPDLFLAHLALTLARGLGQDPLIIPEGERGPAAWIRLVNWLATRLRGDLLLILDDYHKVADVPEVSGLIESILEHRPAGLHVVLGTRVTPPLTLLPRWQISGRARVMGEDKLRLQRQEAATLLTIAGGVSPETRTLDRLMQATEGWALGLQLLAQIFRGRPDQLDQALQSFLRRGARAGSSTAGLLFDYFSAEVLRAQAPATRQFLIEASVLDTLTPGACDAVLGRRDSGSLLQSIEHQGLFLAAVGPACWRFHNLFRGFLRWQLARNPERQLSLHRAAAEYLAGAGETEESVAHWLAAQEYDRAAQSIHSMAHGMLQAGRHATLAYWLDLFPPATLERFPYLLFWRGRLLDVQGLWREALTWYQRAEAGYRADGNLAGLAEVDRRRAYIAVWREGLPGKSQRYLRRAMRIGSPEKLPDEGDHLRNIALTYILQGHPEKARQFCAQAVSTYRRAGNRRGEVWTLLDPGQWIEGIQGNFELVLNRLAVLRRIMGPDAELYFEVQERNCRAISLIFLTRVAEARSVCSEQLRLAEQVDSLVEQAHAHRNLGWVWQMEPDPDLDRAAWHLEQAAALAHATSDLRVGLSTAAARMRLAHGTGDQEGEAQALARCLAYLRRNGDRYLAAHGMAAVGIARTGAAPAEAKAMLDRVLRISARLGESYYRVMAHFGLAVLFRDQPSRLAEHLPEIAAGLRRYGAGFLKFGFESEAAALVRAVEHAGLPADGLSALAGALGPAPAVPDAGVAITTLGRFTVTVGGAAVPEAAWSGSRARDLCGLLAAYHPRPVSKEQVIDAFWGHLRWEAAENGLYKALHGLRRVLDPQGVQARDRWVTLRAGALALAADVWVDATAFAAQVDQGKRLDMAGDRVAAQRAWLAAEQLYGGDFLAGAPAEWAEGRRQYLRNLCTYALDNLAQHASTHGNHPAACLYLERLLAVDPTQEAALQHLIEHLVLAGNRRQARDQYQRYCRILRDELGSAPAPALHELASRLLGTAI